MIWKGRKGEEFTTEQDSRKANQPTLLEIQQCYRKLSALIWKA